MIKKDRSRLQRGASWFLGVRRAALSSSVTWRSQISWQDNFYGYGTKGKLLEQHLQAFPTLLGCQNRTNHESYDNHVINKEIQNTFISILCTSSMKENSGNNGC